MTEPRSLNTNAFQGGGHFEFSSEKNWGVEQDDCKIFDSIDMKHLADGVASIPFNLRHNVPAELFTVEQLHEFEVEASLALSRHTSQCNFKSENETVVATSAEPNRTSETDRLMNLILNNFSCSAESDHINHEIEADGQLDDILGIRKPLIDVLEEETNITNCLMGTAKTSTSDVDCKKIDKNQTASMTVDSEIETIKNESSHWLDSMLDDSDE